MHLKRVIVPNFRALKDVDISFEQDLVPRIFPLGSINGGGKSTLLQLIFTLLHCSGKYERIPYLQNMLDGFEIDNELGYRDLASIELVIDKQTIELDFFVCNHQHIIDKVNVVDGNNEIIELESDLKIFNLINLHNSLDNSFEFIFKIKDRIISLIKNVEKKEIKVKSSGSNDIFETFFNGFNNVRFSEIEIDLIERFIPDQRIRMLLSELNKLKLDSVESKHTVIELLSNILNAINRRESNLLENKRKNLGFKIASNKENLLDNTILFVCYCNTSKQDQELFLMCNMKNLAPANILSKITDQIFLAAPITQVFHFLDPIDKLLLFRADEDGNTYHSRVDEAKLSLGGFFPYDFLAVDILVKAFTDARDGDFKQAISTGEYGRRYQEIIADLAQILGDKKANPELNLDGVNFIKTDEFGRAIQLYPADLSHGELKRLSLYVWLKYNNINDAIILMDEVEIALHPDWQYGIINDFQTWAPNNQYVLATHSYELCQALTPAHVKEIEPKLLKHKK